MVKYLHFTRIYVALIALFLFANCRDSRADCPPVVRYFMLQCDATECLRGVRVETKYLGTECAPKSSVSGITDGELKALSFPLKAASPTHSSAVFSIDTQERCVQDLLENLRHYPEGNALIWRAEIPEPQASPAPKQGGGVILLSPGKQEELANPVPKPPFFECHFGIQELIPEGGWYDYFVQYFMLKFQ